MSGSLQRQECTASTTDTNLRSQHRHLISSCGPRFTQAALSWNCTQWGISLGGGVQFRSAHQYVCLTRGWKVYFFCLLCMLLTQTRTVTAKPLLSLFLKVVCVHQDLSSLWCVIHFFSVSFSFSFYSLSQNPSPLSLALATKLLCSPSLCGYPGALAASLLLDSLVRCWVLHLFSFPSPPPFHLHLV